MSDLSQLKNMLHDIADIVDGIRPAFEDISGRFDANRTQITGLLEGSSRQIDKDLDEKLRIARAAAHNAAADCRTLSSTLRSGADEL